MGGDFAPDMIVYGAVRAALTNGIECILVGREQQLKPLLETGGYASAARDYVSIHPASEVVAMDDLPTQVIRRRDSSMAVAINLAKDGRADAVFSAGNSGALVMGAKSILGLIDRVEKPAIAIVFPTLTDKEVIIIDAGASTDCTAADLLAFAYMGRTFAAQIMGRDNPSIGLFNIGGEAFKGSVATRKAHQLLKKSGLNFKGNIEGNAIPDGVVDIIVCDGFAGNTILKVAEGTALYVAGVLKDESTRGWLSKIGLLFLMPSLKRLKRRIDWKEWGGGVILGLKGNVLIGHGRSDAKAVQNGLKLAQKLGKADLWGKIEKELAAIEA
jgi:glycerol-3-phosphate acyltransferase PlsX